LCSKKYKEKADKREAGVGYEANQISKCILESKDKFIPILLEGEWKSEYMPNFWSTTIGVSCQNGNLTSEKELELINLITNKTKRDE
jgi:hypothetical protein